MIKLPAHAVVVAIQLNDNMMQKITKTLVTLVVVLASPVAFACDYPSRLDTLPDGATATKEEMLAGVKLINTYQSTMTEYLACIEADQVVAEQAIDETDVEASEQSKNMFNLKYNAAVEEQALTVEKFNAEIRAYKAQSN